MNALTQIKNTQKATMREIESGMGEEASWHARYKHSAYVYAGGLAFNMTEGDILAVFSQFGEVVDVNLVRDEEKGRSRGFAFICYADQRSTVLAVDNLNGATVVGRTIKVDHVDDYKMKNEDDANAREWKCACGSENFKFREACFKCGAPRPVVKSGRGELEDPSRQTVVVKLALRIVETSLTPRVLETPTRRTKTRESFVSLWSVKPRLSRVQRLRRKVYLFLGTRRMRREIANGIRRKKRRRRNVAENAVGAETN